MAQFARVPQGFLGYTRSALPHIPLQQSDVTSIGKDSLTRNSYTFAASGTPLVTPVSGIWCALFQRVQFEHSRVSPKLFRRKRNISNARTLTCFRPTLVLSHLIKHKHACAGRSS